MKILLACVGGMSTSLIVSKMKKEADNQGIDCEIEAIDFPAIGNVIDDYDVLLLGPQITYKFRSLKKEFGAKVPVEMIDAQSYGLCDGKAILAQAMQIYKENQK